MAIYLCVKQHTVTGMLYFCKTTGPNFQSYRGSGKYWKRHIRKHGAEFVVHIKHWTFTDQDRCTKFALRFSKFHDIQNSSEWANLIAENGLDGAPKGVVFTEEHKQNLRGKTRSKSHCENLKRNHTRPMLGKKFSAEHRRKISENNVGFKGKSHSDESKKKTSESLKIAAARRPIRTCPHCGVSGKGGNMTRYHSHNCKQLTP